jgi:CBS domain containing-hemolysin-like protein
MNDTFRKSINWSLGIAVITFVLAAIFSIISTYTLSGVTWAMGMVVVLIIVFIGVFFDMLGVAATAADEVPFHAMASEKVKGSRHAILIVRNADRFANFCNDVIGDISGIISGTASAIVLIQVAVALDVNENGPTQLVISVIFTSLIAALTVGGKAIGKTIAITFSTNIVFQVGKLFYFAEDKLKLNILKDTRDKKKKQNSKRK